MTLAFHIDSDGGDSFPCLTGRLPGDRATALLLHSLVANRVRMQRGAQGDQQSPRMQVRILPGPIHRLTSD